MTSLSKLEENASRIAGRLKLMGHSERLLMLCRMDEGEVSVTQLVELTRLSQSSVSQHLALLRKAGLVNVRYEAHRRFYRLSDPIVSGLVRCISEGLRELR